MPDSARNQNKDAHKGSEDTWLQGAYELLINGGVEAVKIMPLAKHLNLSRTSFYWYFADREELLDALIKRWQNKNTGNLIAQTELYAASIVEGIFNLFDCWLVPDLFDRKLDIAIRHWANQNQQLKQLVDQMDQQRIAAIKAMFERFGYSPENANVRAGTVYYTQIGHISLMVEESKDARLQKMPDYVEIFTGVKPQDSDIARFVSRHQ